MEREPIATEPDAELAAMIAAEVIGHPPAKVRRFTTGVRHYVFDVEFAGRPPVVVRIGNTSAQPEMAGAAYLSGLLRPRGVPLPAILAQDLEPQFPWLVVERLPGTDLGEVIGSLSSEHLERRARRLLARMGRTTKWRAASQRDADAVGHPPRSAATRDRYPTDGPRPNPAKPEPNRIR
jgi:aminoglycoside phosphotransferase